MSYVIGMDLGTQSLKGVLIDPSGKTVAEASHAHEPSYPNAGWAEQTRAMDWIDSMVDVVHKIMADSGISPDEVEMIGFDSQVDGAVAVDNDGNPLTPALIWLDRRAEAQTAAMGKKIAEEKIFELTGLNLDSSHVAPKVLWIRETYPDIFEKCSNILLPGSFMVKYLTGEAVVDYSNASSTMIYNVNTKAWDPEIAKALDLDPMILGRIGPSHEVAGHLTERAAELLGLTTNCRVVIGSGDEHAACLGAGLVRPGMVCDITGTAEPVCAVGDKPLLDHKHLVETHAHADSRWWLIENPGFVSGGSMRWFKDNIVKSDYGMMNELAAKVAPGSDGVIFLPCMSGAMTPRWNGNARGIFSGLSLNHGMEHITRAVFEGIAFGLRDNIDRFEEIGIDCSEVRIVGGGTKSPLWCQMKADCIGKTMQCTKNPEGAAIGAAMMASVANGFFKDMDEAAEAMVELDDKIYEPDPTVKEAYDEAYARYLATYDAMEPVYDKLYKGE